MIKKTNVRQIGFLVWDLDKAMEHWTALLGVEPSISETATQEITKATADGQPCYGRNRQAIYRLENIEIELIMPLGEEYSYWRHCIEKNGTGFHHIAFETDDMETARAEMEQSGFPVRQHGYWPDEPKDGQYAYADATDNLDTVIELLEYSEPTFSGDEE